MIHRFGVKVMPREVLLDIQGRAVEQTLRLQQEPVKSCRVGKFIELEIEGETKVSQERAYEIARNVLHNPLIETFELIQIS